MQSLFNRCNQKKNQRFKENHFVRTKMVALFMCFIMSVLNLDGVAFAISQDTANENGITITKINKIDDEICNQYVDEGGEESEIKFPKNITAAVDNSQDSVELPVTWKLKKGVVFDSSEERSQDSYNYQPVLPEGYKLDDKVTMPEIVVTINSDHFISTVTVNDVKVSLIADKGVFPEDATLKVDKIEDKIDGEKIKEAINHSLGEEKNQIEKACSYDIKVLSGEGAELQPDTSKGESKIVFKNMDMASDKKKGKNVDVYHIDDDFKNAELIETEVDTKDNTLKINVEHFSIYTVTVTAVPETASGNFTSLVIRKDSEYGEVVADLTHSSISETSPVLVPGQEYYLCVSAYSPRGKGGYLKMTLGNTDGVSVERNGLTYVNIPGNTYKVGGIDHDSFDKLMVYEDCADPIYGSADRKFSMPDGVLTYNIKAEKTNGRPISCAVGFKVDETYWNNLNLLMNALHLEMGTIGEDTSLNCTDKMDSDIGIDTSEKKNYTLNTSSTINTQLNTTALPFSITISDSKSTQIFR